MPIIQMDIVRTPENYETVRYGSNFRVKPANFSINMTGHMAYRVKATGLKSTNLAGGNPATYAASSMFGESSYGIPYLGPMGKSLRTKLEFKAGNRLRDKVRGVQFDLGTFLGELPETISFIRDGAREGLESFKKTKNRVRALEREIERLHRRATGNRVTAILIRKRIGILTDQIASLWLAYRYGLMPLYYATRDAVEYLRDNNSQALIRNVRTSAKESYSGSGRGFDGMTGNEFDGSKTVDIRVSAVAIVKIEPGLEELQKLGLDNLLAVSWELVPLSFVVDWLIPVGEYLSGLTAGVGKTFVAGTVSTKVNVFRETHEKIFGGRRYEYAHYTCTYYSRTVLTGLPTPRLYLDLNMNMKRYLDAFALIKQMFLKTSLTKKR